MTRYSYENGHAWIPYEFGDDPEECGFCHAHHGLAEPTELERLTREELISVIDLLQRRLSYSEELRTGLANALNARAELMDRARRLIEDRMALMRGQAFSVAEQCGHQVAQCGYSWCGECWEKEAESVVDSLGSRPSPESPDYNGPISDGESLPDRAALISVSPDHLCNSKGFGALGDICPACEAEVPGKEITVKKFSTLREKMSPESQTRATERAQELVHEIHDESRREVPDPLAKYATNPEWLDDANQAMQALYGAAADHPNQEVIERSVKRIQESLRRARTGIQEPKPSQEQIEFLAGESYELENRSGWHDATSAEQKESREWARETLQTLFAIPKS